MKKQALNAILLGLSLVLLAGCDLFDSSSDNPNPNPTPNPTPKIKGCMISNSYNYNPQAQEDDGSCKTMFGCLGYAAGFSNSGSLGVTLNNASYDQKMNEEVAIQKNFYNGIPAAVYIWYEPSPEMKNALATPGGQILFGYSMFYYTVSTYGELPVAGILAHEFGHRTQFTYGWNDYTTNAQKELEADAFSGFYMALRKQYAWSQIQSYYQNVYASGNYDFNHPQFHGTPEQRLASAYLGVTTAINAMNNNIQYSYNDLHTIFIQSIKFQIGGRKAAPDFREVKYPVISKELVAKLYPQL